MPLFHIKGRAPDETYLFDENPDPERYELAPDQLIRLVGEGGPELVDPPTDDDEESA